MNWLQLLKGNPQGAFQLLVNTNPKFAKFVQDNQGKSPEQIAREHGIDINQVQQLLK